MADVLVPRPSVVAGAGDGQPRMAVQHVQQQNRREKPPLLPPPNAFGKSRNLRPGMLARLVQERKKAEFVANTLHHHLNSSNTNNSMNGSGNHNMNSTNNGVATNGLTTSAAANHHHHHHLGALQHHYHQPQQQQQQQQQYGNLYHHHMSSSIGAAGPRRRENKILKIFAHSKSHGSSRQRAAMAAARLAADNTNKGNLAANAFHRTGSAVPSIKHTHGDTKATRSRNAEPEEKESMLLQLPNDVLVRLSLPLSPSLSQHLYAQATRIATCERYHVRFSIALRPW